MSFADGFKSGFGLIGDVQDRALNNKRLDEQKRQGDLDRDMQTQRYNLDRDATALYRKGQNDIEKRRVTVAEQNAATSKIKATNEETQLGLDETRINADAGLRTAQTKVLTDAQELKEKRRGQRETNAAASLQVQSFVDLAEKVRTGEAAYDADTQARLAEMAKATSGSMLDLDYVTQPNVQFQAGRLNEVLEQMSLGNFDQINETALRDTFNVVFHSNNMAGVGELVTSETHKNAGSFADKGFVVVGKQVSKVSLDGNSLGLTVDVLIENPETGETFTYESPMTVGREASGEKAFMSVTEAVQAASGYYQYANAMAPYRGMLNEINARGYDLIDGRQDGDFKQLVANDINEAVLDGKRNPDLSSPIKGMTMREFSADVGRMRSHYSGNRVGNYQPPEAALAGDRLYNQFKDQPVIKDLSRLNEGKPPSRAKILEAAQYVSIDDKGNAVIDNANEWKAWKNQTFRRAGQSDAPFTMTDAYKIKSQVVPPTEEESSLGLINNRHRIR